MTCAQEEPPAPALPAGSQLYIDDNACRILPIMTAHPQERPLPQPQSKALPTVQSSYPDIVATKAGSISRPPSRARVTKPKLDVSVKDFTSKGATLSLIRRTLIRDNPQNVEAQSIPIPIEGILPPLTSSNQVDLQLYAIVAIIIKDFVNTWYSKITPDRSFIDEVIQIIAHCSRALEERIRRTDVVELILDEVPLILERHVHGRSSDLRESSMRSLTAGKHIGQQHRPWHSIHTVYAQ